MFLMFSPWPGLDGSDPWGMWSLGPRQFQSKICLRLRRSDFRYIMLLVEAISSYKFVRASFGATFGTQRYFSIQFILISFFSPPAALGTQPYSSKQFLL